MTDLAANDNTTPTTEGTRPFEHNEIASEDLDALLASNTSGLIRKSIERAYAGDRRALLACVEEALRREHNRSVRFVLPASLDTVEDLKQNSRAVIEACCAGLLAPEQALAIQNLLSKHEKLFVNKGAKGLAAPHFVSIDPTIYADTLAKLEKEKAENNDHGREIRKSAG